MLVVVEGIWSQGPCLAMPATEQEVIRRMVMIANDRPYDKDKQMPLLRTLRVRRRRRRPLGPDRPSGLA